MGLSMGDSFAMGNRFTRRRFLAAVGAGATYFALANTTGCESAERASRAKPATRSQPTRPGRVVASGSSGSSSRRGAWAFRSRPDLSPPAVEVSKKARATAPGYIFLAPQKGDAGQGGSLIVDNEGQVVWFRPLQETYGRAMDLKAQTYRGRPVLTWMEDRSGEYVICDHTYHEIARIEAGNGYEGDQHEFLISPQDTALITIYNWVPWDLSSVGGPKESVAVQGTVQEIDIETGEVLLEWKSLDHVGLDESYGKPGEDIESTGIDYFHLNSIDVDHDDNLLICARKTCAVYKIDRNTGGIIWRLGGKKSDFEMGPGTRFAFQHDARRLPDGTISIFDNGDTVFENGFPKAVEESRAIVLDVDEGRMSASLVGEYKHPDGQKADAAGNAQLLPNGDMFVGWGRALSISEFAHDGELLFDLRSEYENKTYRAFRFPWSGTPGERPAVVAERTSAQEVRLYASCNGATEITSWEVLAGTNQNQLEPLSSVARNGFETAMVVHTTDRYVAVRAKDRSGRVLGTSAAVEPRT
jgi:hypothetical protein